MVFVSVLVFWLVSLCLHEYAHARTAYAGGDTSVVAKGYLSMNPLKYMHPMLSVVLPLVFLALGFIALPGGAVWIDTSRIRTRGWLALVSLAGPLANLGMFALCALPFALGWHIGRDEMGTLWPSLAVCAYFQALAFVLNMLPIPGLDGYGVLEPFLPNSVREHLDYVRPAGFFILLAIFLTENPVKTAIAHLISGLVRALDVSPMYLNEGMQLFRSTL
jgi:Zn-dependent protease